MLDFTSHRNLEWIYLSFTFNLFSKQFRVINVLEELEGYLLTRVSIQPRLESPSKKCRSNQANSFHGSRLTLPVPCRFQSFEVLDHPGSTGFKCEKFNVRDITITCCCYVNLSRVYSCYPCFPHKDSSIPLQAWQQKL